MSTENCIEEHDIQAKRQGGSRTLESGFRVTDRDGHYLVVYAWTGQFVVILKAFFFDNYWMGWYGQFCGRSGDA